MRAQIRRFPRGGGNPFREKRASLPVSVRPYGRVKVYFSFVQGMRSAARGFCNRVSALFTQDTERMYIKSLYSQIEKKTRHIPYYSCAPQYLCIKAFLYYVWLFSCACIVKKRSVLVSVRTRNESVVR